MVLKRPLLWEPGNIGVLGFKISIQVPAIETGLLESESASKSNESVEGMRVN